MVVKQDNANNPKPRFAVRKLPRSPWMQKLSGFIRAYRQIRARMGEDSPYLFHFGGNRLIRSKGRWLRDALAIVRQECPDHLEPFESVVFDQTKWAHRKGMSTSFWLAARLWKCQDEHVKDKLNNWGGWGDMSVNPALYYVRHNNWESKEDEEPFADYFFGHHGKTEDVQVPVTFSTFLHTMRTGPVMTT
jgi:hypothetical protein